MTRSIEVLFSPVEFSALSQRNLGRTACVVLDILRATTSMITALANGAEAIIPVGEIAEALAIKQQRPEVLLAGERNGLRIRGDLTGGNDFDFGNSPREFLPEKVRGIGYFCVQRETLNVVAGLQKDGTVRKLACEAPSTSGDTASVYSPPSA